MAPTPPPMDLNPANIREEQGLCWVIGRLPFPPGDDLWRPKHSRLTVSEDGCPLQPGHSSHDLVRFRGGGRYSHWGTSLFFSTSDGSDPRSNGRGYGLTWGPEVCPTPPIGPELEDMAATIRGGGEAASDDISRRLSRGTAAERAFGLRLLGDAFLDAGDGDLGAKQLWRAWQLGLREQRMWFPILCWLRHSNQHEAVHSLFKSAAAEAEATNDPDWMTDLIVRYESFGYDRYPSTHILPFQDEFVAGPAKRLLSRYKLPLPEQPNRRRLRVGYLLSGEALNCYHHHTDIAVHLILGHDPATVDAMAISLHAKDAVLAVNPFFPAWLDRMDAADRPIHFLDVAWAGTLFADTLEAAKALAALDLDALVFSGQCGLHFLMAALRPARLLVGLGMGEPPLYTSRLLDVAAQFTRRPAMDSLCPSEPVPPFISPDRFRPPQRSIPRSELGVAEEAVVMVSAGRAMKFDSALYWTVVISVMRRNPQCWLMLIGITEAQLDGLDDTRSLPPDLRLRIRALGWRDDVIEVMAAGDIYLDTLPYGGGHTVFEALHLGLPAVMIRDEYLEPWSVTTWSPAAELLPANIACACDSETLIARLCTLIEAPAQRHIWREAGPQAVHGLKEPSRCSAVVEQIIRNYGGWHLDGERRG
jgi:glycosyltransferase involved in cell wall biosynthesis